MPDIVPLFVHFFLFFGEFILALLCAHFVGRALGNNTFNFHLLIFDGLDVTSVFRLSCFQIALESGNS